MKQKTLEMTSSQAKTGLEWGDSTQEATRFFEKRSFKPSAGLRSLGISATC